MATRVELELRENNDEVVELTITPVDPDDDLSLITTLELYLKDGDCFVDAHPNTLVLSSDDPSEITILTQTTDEITAEAFIPASALTVPYDRFWRVDALNAGGDRRTALYGPVDVISL